MNIKIGKSKMIAIIYYIVLLLISEIFLIYMIIVSYDESILLSLLFLFFAIGILITLLMDIRKRLSLKNGYVSKDWLVKKILSKKSFFQKKSFRVSIFLLVESLTIIMVILAYEKARFYSFMIVLADISYLIAFFKHSKKLKEKDSENLESE